MVIRLTKSVLFFSGALIFLACLPSCFKTRVVEPPSNASSDWISPSDYQILLQNLKTAISNGNSQNYVRCFNDESFEYTPAAVVLNDNESIWQNWSIEEEQAYFSKLLAELTATSGNSLILEQIDLQDVGPDSLKYVGSYLLRMNHNDSDLTTLFKGQVQWVIKANAFNEWEIHRWVDLEVFPDSSWSRLKLGFVQ